MGFVDTRLLDLTWSEFKSIITTRGVKIEMVELSDYYLLKGFDGSFQFSCGLPKDNGADQIDFETNYKSSVESSVSDFNGVATYKFVWARQDLKNGSAVDMNVNGSVTPVAFSFAPSAGQIHWLKQVCILIIDTGTMDPTDFATIAGGLTNGLVFSVRANGVVHTISTMKNNIDVTLTFPNFNMTFSTSGWLEQADVFFSRIVFEGSGIKLIGNQSDYVRMTVNDNLTSVDLLRTSTYIFRSS